VSVSARPAGIVLGEARCAYAAAGVFGSEPVDNSTK
jgi:hypothetical protein